jgi:uncharacterized repeat protein (TIGR04138 family)
MPPEDNFSDAIEKIVEKDTRYSRAAYYFLREGLDFTVKNLKEKPERKRQADSNVPNHVSAQELLDGLRDYALEQFGPMAATLLSQWGLREAENIGDIVFNLVEAQVFGKTDNDSREDFKNRHDFADNLRAPFKPRPDTILLLKKALVEAAEESKNEDATFRNITEKVFGDMQALLANMKTSNAKKTKKGATSKDASASQTPAAEEKSPKGKRRAAKPANPESTKVSATAKTPEKPGKIVPEKAKKTASVARAKKSAKPAKPGKKQ